MALKALIWDVDGTLIDNEELHRAAFNRAFTEAGLDWRWNRETYAELLKVSGGKERMAAYIWSLDQPPPLADAAGFLAGLHARKTDLYSELLRSGDVSPRPGVVRLLREARDAGVKQAIATTTSPRNVQTLVSRFFADIPFATVAAGDVVASKKPAPDVYLLVLGALGLTPESCLAIEDSRNGLMAATAAGVPTLVTPSFYTQDENFSGAMAVAEHLGEPDLPARILRSAARGAVIEQEMVDLARLKSWSRATRR